MNLLQRLSLRVRLLLLAGVPFAGALVLAVVIAHDARMQAAAPVEIGTLRFGVELSLVVVVVSMLVAFFVWTGITRSLAARDGELATHRSNLEALVWARTEQLANRNTAMRFVFDNVEQGLAMIRRDGTIHAERSAKFDVLLGAPGPHTTFAELIDPTASSLRDALELGWEAACDGVFPADIALDQLPKHVVRDGRQLMFDFRPVVRDDIFEGALLVVTDVTSEIEARAEHDKQREYVAIFERAAQDREGFIAFVEETGELLARLDDTTDSVPAFMRILHTIKGNTSQWGVSSVTRLAHDIESDVTETGAMPTAKQRAALSAAWKATTDRVTVLLGARGGAIEISRAEVDELLRDALANADRATLIGKLERLYAEPVAARFQRLELDIDRLAKRLHKPRPAVVIEANGVRLPAARFGAFWGSLVHVVRNMMDHGIETAEERVAVGKSEAGNIVLRAVETADRITIECSDDGAGIDWVALAAKARAAGLPCRTQLDLDAALFSVGVSTAREVTEISGRGVGLPAVLERCNALGGSVRITSSKGNGTRCTFSFPRRGDESIAPPQPKKSAREPFSQRPAATGCA